MVRYVTQSYVECKRLSYETIEKYSIFIYVVIICDRISYPRMWTSYFFGAPLRPGKRMASLFFRIFDQNSCKSNFAFDLCNLKLWCVVRNFFLQSLRCDPPLSQIATIPTFLRTSIASAPMTAERFPATRLAFQWKLRSVWRKYLTSSTPGKPSNALDPFLRWEFDWNSKFWVI